MTTMEAVQVSEIGFENMKNEFNFMKTKFSPQFLQRIEKSMQGISSINYDLEVIKMSIS